MGVKLNHRHVKFFSDPEVQYYSRTKMSRKERKFVYFEKFIKICLMLAGKDDFLTGIDKLQTVIHVDSSYTWGLINSSNLHPEDDSFNKTIYNKGIQVIGVKNFLSAAVKFVKEETRDGRLDIISVGSGGGSIEKEVYAAYCERYGNSSRLNFFLVDPDPQYTDLVDFRFVDDLIGKRPQAVGNCVLFLIWPEPRANNDGYDIDSIRKLQPRAVLTVYGTVSDSGSEEFVRALQHDDNIDLPITKTGAFNWVSLHVETLIGDGDCGKFGIDNYLIDEVAHVEIPLGPVSGTTVIRLKILRRTDDRFFKTCPTINVTCETSSLETHAERINVILTECPSHVCPSRDIVFGLVPKSEKQTFF